MDLKGDLIVHLVGEMRRGLATLHTCGMLETWVVRYTGMNVSEMFA